MVMFLQMSFSPDYNSGAGEDEQEVEDDVVRNVSLKVNPQAAYNTILS